MVSSWISLAIMLFSLSEVLPLSRGDVKKLSSLTPISTQGMLNVSQLAKQDKQTERGLLIGKHPLVTVAGDISDENAETPGEELLLSEGQMMRDESGHEIPDAPCSMEDLMEEEKKLTKEEEEFKALVDELKKKMEEYELEESAFENFRRGENNTELLGVLEDEEKLKADLKELEAKEEGLKGEESKLAERESEILKNETALEEEEKRHKTKIEGLTKKESELNAAIEKLKADLRHLDVKYEEEEKKEQDKRGYVCFDMPSEMKNKRFKELKLGSKICNPKESMIDITELRSQCG